MKMSDKEKEEKDITEQLGPITEFHMKMRLPQAFVDYVEEVGLCRGGSHKAKQRGCKPRRILQSRVFSRVDSLSRQ